MKGKGTMWPSLSAENFLLSYYEARLPRIWRGRTRRNSQRPYMHEHKEPRSFLFASSKEMSKKVEKKGWDTTRTSDDFTLS